MVGARSESGDTGGIDRWITGMRSRDRGGRNGSAAREPHLDRSKYYSVLLPAAGIIFVIAMFLLDWNGTAVVIGALILGLIAVLGRMVPLGTTGRIRDRNRSR